MRELSRIIGLLQVDSTIGDLSGNSLRLEELASIAEDNGALMGITTELAVSGYPHRDLLLQPDFVKMSQEQASSLSVNIPVLVGTPVVPDGERKLPSN